MFLVVGISSKLGWRDTRDRGLGVLAPRSLRRKAAVQKSTLRILGMSVAEIGAALNVYKYGLLSHGPCPGVQLESHRHFRIITTTHIHFTQSFLCLHIPIQTNMRPQQLAALFAFLSLGYLVAADIDIDHDDVDKRECWDVCKPIVRLSNDCDHKYDDDDRAELNCVCSGPNARTLIPLCEACVAKYDDDDDDDDRHDNGMYLSRHIMGHDHSIRPIVFGSYFPHAPYKKLNWL